MNKDRLVVYNATKYNELTIVDDINKDRTKPLCDCCCMPMANVADKTIYILDSLDRPIRHIKCTL